MDIQKSLEEGSYNVRLSGKFTFSDQGAFRSILDAIGHEGVGCLALDMAAVTFIDSAGLGQLLLAHDQAAEYHKPLVIRGAAGQVKKMFEMAHFDTLFTLQP